MAPRPDLPMWDKIIGAIVKGFLGFIKVWYTQEKKIEAEWLAKSKAGQLESMKRTMATESKLKEAMDSARIVSPAEWNAGK